MILYTLIIAFVIALLILHWRKTRKLPPGPVNLPFLGCLLSLDPEAPHKSLSDLAKKYGPIYSLYLGNVFTVVLSDARLVRKVFSMEVVTDRPKLFLTDGIMKGRGLVSAQGPLWKDQRKFAMTCFRSFGMYKNSPKRFNMEAMILEEVKGLLNFLHPENSSQTTLDPLQILRHHIGTVLNLIIFGKAWPREDDTWLWLQSLQEEGVKHIGVAGPLNFLPVCRHLPHFKKTVNYILDGKEKTHQLYRQLIEEQQALMAKKADDDYDNLIQMYLSERQKRQGTPDAENFYNLDQFCHFLADIFGAGLDTTLVTLRWFLLYISKHEHIQTMLYEEIDNVLENRTPSIEDIPNLPLVEACISEAQRIRSVVPLGIPHANYSEFELEGYRIPKNTMLLSLQWAIHMDEINWAEPEKYDPLRFINEEGRYVKRNAFMPFQAGKRMCIGDEFSRMLLFLFSVGILQKFSVHPASDVDFSGENGITLSPKPHELSFILRNVE